jgi:hypothetical protein
MRYKQNKSSVRELEPVRPRCLLALGENERLHGHVARRNLLMQGREGSRASQEVAEKGAVGLIFFTFFN